ncbi:hypothetical protein C8Q80DRAFT_1132927 [Daedaleopsis nitida]|nr:hypothetical protein C8Q80DRAFT_1132927 [Daedaleopsis nitida]
MLVRTAAGCIVSRRPGGPSLPSRRGYPSRHIYRTRTLGRWSAFLSFCVLVARGTRTSFGCIGGMRAPDVGRMIFILDAERVLMLSLHLVPRLFGLRTRRLAFRTGFHGATKLKAGYRVRMRIVIVDVLTNVRGPCTRTRLHATSSWPTSRYGAFWGEASDPSELVRVRHDIVHVGGLARATQSRQRRRWRWQGWRENAVIVHETLAPSEVYRSVRDARRKLSPERPLAHTTCAPPSAPSVPDNKHPAIASTAPQWPSHCTRLWRISLYL